MQIFAMNRGDMFIYRNYLCEVTDEWRQETSQRYIKQVASKMDDKWHSSNGAGDWFNWYYETELVTIAVIKKPITYLVTWRQKIVSGEHWTTHCSEYSRQACAESAYKALLPGECGSFGPIVYRDIHLSAVISEAESEIK